MWKSVSERRLLFYFILFYLLFIQLRLDFDSTALLPRYYHSTTYVTTVRRCKNSIIIIVIIIQIRIFIFPGVVVEWA